MGETAGFFGAKLIRWGIENYGNLMCPNVPIVVNYQLASW